MILLQIIIVVALLYVLCDYEIKRPKYLYFKLPFWLKSANIKFWYYYFKFLIYEKWNYKNK